MNDNNNMEENKTNSKAQVIDDSQNGTGSN